MARLSKEDRALLAQLEERWVYGSTPGRSGWYLSALFSENPYVVPDKSDGHNRILRSALGRQGMSLMRKTARKRSALIKRMDQLQQELRRVEDQHVRELVSECWGRLPYQERQGLAHYFVGDTTGGSLFGLELLERLRHERVQYHRDRGDETSAKRLERRHKANPILRLDHRRRLEAMRLARGDRSW